MTVIYANNIKGVYYRCIYVEVDCQEEMIESEVIVENVTLFCVHFEVYRFDIVISVIKGN